MANASYTKLRSGEWGVRVQGNAKAGETITVAKKSGETKSERIAKIVWSGNGVTLCAIERSEAPRSSSGSSSHRVRSGGSCRECRGPIVNAPHHRAMGGLCGVCAFDEYDC